MKSKLMHVSGITAATLAVLLVGCTPAPASNPIEVPAASADPIVEVVPDIEEVEEEVVDGASSIEATFESVVDGDTIRTSAGTVRIIGIDTPEQGECGYAEASMSIGALIAHGDTITLALPEGQNDTDRHDRLIRYVITADGIDIGMHQIVTGNAIARYDSRDGYPAHPHEDSYHAAQIAERDANGFVMTTACKAQSQAQKPAPSDTQVPLVGSTPTTSADDAWWRQYSSCTKLKRNTNGHPTGPFNVDNEADHEIYMWFAYGTGNNGDGDNDGLACE